MTMGTLTKISKVPHAVKQHKMKKNLLLFLYCILLSLPITADPSQTNEEGKGMGRANTSVPIVQMEAEQLPSLNIPRSGHHTFVMGNTVYVMGGHTKGFIPTPTMEYYEDGEWHTINMVYTHGFGACQPMRSGKVLIAGGNEKPLGIGQTFTVELFDSKTRTCEGYGCLEQKRFFVSSAELPNGKVIISGNSYSEDCTECFDGSRQNQLVQEVAQERVLPFIFPIAEDDAIIFSSLDKYQKSRTDTIIIDQLKGKPFQAPLFEEWYPLDILLPHSAESSFIGDERTGNYSYLLTVFNKKSGQMAIARVVGTDIQLLQTKYSVPMQYAPEGASHPMDIHWITTVIADRQVRRGYVLGHDDDYRFYVLAVEYDKDPAPLTLYYTEPQDSAANYTPVLTPEGDLIMAGGVRDNNYNPYRTVIRFHLAPQAPQSASDSWLLWGILAMLLIAGFVGILIWRRRMAQRKNGQSLVEEAPMEASSAEEETDQQEPSEVDEASPSRTPNEELMERIRNIIEQKRLYLNSELKVANVAAELGINQRYVSNAIKTCHDCSFSQFVNDYRIEHAKQMLRDQPDIKITAVVVQSGFANETSFFRTFKSFTGMTPKEWIAEQN